ncbi:sulfatase [Echinicola sediminis]
MFYFKILSTLILLTLTSFCCKAYITDQPPNIEFILADVLGWSDLPIYGNQFNEAPNLIKLADQGMLFTNAYAANPVCSPTRASIQTGQYPARIGINDFLPGHWRPYEKLKVPANKTQYLPLSYITIGEGLQQAGYRTGYFGKWHLGLQEKHFPKNQGYDESVVYRGGGFFSFGEKMYPAQEFPKGTVLSEALTELSINFIEKNKERPFFLFLAHYDVHVQLDADSTLIHKYLKKPKAKNYPSNAIYAAMIEHLDRSVGSIMDKLDKEGLTENTIIVFFSDNGGLIKRFDEIPLIDKRSLHYYEKDTLKYIASSNAPLRAEKGTLFEGGIREPMIVRWPGKIKAKAKSDVLVSSIDFFPTFLTMAGAPLPKEQMVDGIDLTSIFHGNEPKEQRTLFWHYPVYHHASPASAIRMGDWKLIHFMEGDQVKLFNLKEDIGETTDLSIEKQGIRDKLFSFLQEWRKDVQAAMPILNPDYDLGKKHLWEPHPHTEDMLKGTDYFKEIIPQ